MLVSDHVAPVVEQPDARIGDVRGAAQHAHVDRAPPALGDAIERFEIGQDRLADRVRGIDHARDYRHSNSVIIALQHGDTLAS